MPDIVLGFEVYDDADRHALALAAARDAGCTCDPQIDFVRDPFSPDELPIFAAQVAHDEWCPILR